MDNTHSLARELWRFIKAEPEELIVFAIAIVGLVGVAAYRVFMQGDTQVANQDIASVLTAAKESLTGFFNKDDSWGRVFLFGFWSILGALTYAIVWGITAAMTTIRKDIAVSASFTHPGSFHNSDYWTAIIGRYILRAGSLLALIFYSVFWVIAFAPVWIVAIQGYFSHGISLGALLNIICGTIAIWVSLHIAAILLRLVLLRAHYSYER